MLSRLRRYLAGIHPAIEMSDDEVDEFLNRHRTLRLATISSDGFPHNVPVGYMEHGGRG